MAANTYTIEGATTSLYFQLLDSGVPIDLNDYTIDLFLTGIDGVTVNVSGDITSTFNGVVIYTPGVTDLSALVSPYKARWKLTEDTGAIAYVPSAYRDEWNILPV
jgi:hypothetical protein